MSFSVTWRGIDPCCVSISKMPPAQLWLEGPWAVVCGVCFIWDTRFQTHTWEDTHAHTHRQCHSLICWPIPLHALKHVGWMSVEIRVPRVKVNNVFIMSNLEHFTMNLSTDTSFCSKIRHFQQFFRWIQKMFLPERQKIGFAYIDSCKHRKKKDTSDTAQRYPWRDETAFIKHSLLMMQMYVFDVCLSLVITLLLSFTKS